MATTNTWRLTDAGRAALADGLNRGVRAVSFASLAVGSGSAPGGASNDARTTLSAQTDTGVLTGTTTVAGRIALQATIVSTAAYQVTEVGLFARIGAGAEFLAAYWTDDGRAVAAAASAGDTLVLAGILDIQAAAADVTVTVNPALTLNPPASLAELLAGLADEEYLRVAVQGGAPTLTGLARAAVLSDLLRGLAVDAFVRIRERAGLRSLLSRSASQTLSDLLDGLDNNAFVRVRNALGARSFEGLTRAQLLADLLTGIGGRAILRTNAAGDGIEAVAGAVVRDLGRGEAGAVVARLGTDWVTCVSRTVETVAGDRVLFLTLIHGASRDIETLDATITARLRRGQVEIGEWDRYGRTPALTALPTDHPPAGHNEYVLEIKSDTANVRVSVNSNADAPAEMLAAVLG